MGEVQGTAVVPIHADIIYKLTQNIRYYMLRTSLFILTLLLPASVLGQGTLEDYHRSQEIKEAFRGAVLHQMIGQPSWIGDSNQFWYRRSVSGGSHFIRVNADQEIQELAFDHERLAGVLSEKSGEEFTGETLPFYTFEYKEDFREIEFAFEGENYLCSLISYECESREDDRERPSHPTWGVWDHEREPVILSHSRSSSLSPDETKEALIENYNLLIRDVESGAILMKSSDGSEGNYYDFHSIQWSPDSRNIAVKRVAPGYDRKIHYVESSPAEQRQPRYLSRTYIKPGDQLDVEQPVLFRIEEGQQIHVDRSLFPNAYSQTGFRWQKDSRGFTFEYNERGHQRYRIIEVDAQTGEPRIVVNEEPETFFSYATSLFRGYSEDGDEIVWMSERDGWRHLYLYDARSGSVKNQITRGEWVVRNVDHVDWDNRQIWFSAGGYYEDQDPYFIHHFRIDFDGGNLTPLTHENGTHSVSFSPEREYYTDTWSRVDTPPVTVLKRTSDQSVVLVLEKADHSELVRAGWQAPEPFSAKARDGETDIYGIIIRPTNFDPGQRYPVIEYIYAGPHDHFVPKSFMAYNQMMSLAETGFIVVQIDGMGTAQRSKAFHDVAWRNLGDAGFPDRILWHQAVAETYDWYDNSKVGIYGRSAGGQSSLGGLLFHPEHYHVAVSSVGCHDNRMDKIWWNEQWMGWPVDEHYSAASNVDHAHKLQGNVLLVVGELDTNVDPASTYQVADALIKAGKDFDFLTIPGADHASIGIYEERKRMDYFIRHLHGITPPSWNQITDGEVFPFD